MIKVEIGDRWRLGKHELWCHDATADCAPRFDADLILTDPPFDLSAAIVEKTIIRQADKYIVAGHGRQYHRICTSRSLHYHFEVVSQRSKPQSTTAMTGAHILHWNNVFLSKDGHHCFDRDLAGGYFPSVLPAASTKVSVPYAKPLEWALTLLSACHADRICDPFSGSGTVLIAAEKLGKSCCAIEVDPDRCSATIARWENAAKKTAEKI